MMNIKKDNQGEQTPKIETVSFNIAGMTCDHCATTISNKFTGVNGIKDKMVRYPEGQGEFSFDPAVISKEKIKEIIDSTGSYKVENEIKETSGNSSHQYDLIIIGGGSAAFSAAIQAENLGLSTLMVNAGLDFGGTCVNVGCVPSKTLIRAGEAAHHGRHSNFEGVKPKGVDIDFGRVIRDKKKLVADLQQQKYMDVVRDYKNLTMIKGWAEFKDEKTIRVNGKDEYKALKFLIATGSTSHIPDIKGLDTINYLTHVSLFDLEEQPESLIILGGGYIALEVAQAYHRLGTKVTVLQRSSHVLSGLTPDIGEALTGYFMDEDIHVHTGIIIDEVSEDQHNVRVLAQHKGGQQVFESEKIMVATGMKPNTEKLGLANTGLQLTDKGHIAVDEQMQTHLPHIFAAGDVVSTPAYVYTAAYEGRIAVENAFTGAGNKIGYESLPWVIFTDPQVAGVGLDEKQAEAQNIPFEVSKLELQHVPKALAAHDTRGFIKLIRNTETDRLMGARIVAPEGGELIQQLSMAIQYNIPVADLANSLYPYLTHSEGIKLAAIAFHKDVNQLSCCAS